MTTTRITRDMLRRMGLKAKPKAKAPMQSTHVDSILASIRAAGFDAVTEYRFSKRQFRFDIALLGERIAIEYEGGIYTGGRHTRATGYAKDCQKYNLATAAGWRVFRFTAKDIQAAGPGCAVTAIQAMLEHDMRKITQH